MLFACLEGIKPEIDLHQVIDEITKKRGGRWDKKSMDTGEWKCIPRRLEKKEIQEVRIQCHASKNIIKTSTLQQRVEFVNTALDTAVESRHVDLTLLIQDENGHTSEQFSIGQKEYPDLELGKKRTGKTLYRKIANSDCEVSI